MLTRETLLAFLRRLGAAADTPGRCFLTGGASALLEGWRRTTVDIDLHFDPEPAGVFEAIPGLKRDLGVNVKLAAPFHFVPVPAGWADRSPAVGQFGRLEVHHFDFIGQALAKLARGFARDLEDVQAMLARGFITPAGLRHAFEEVQPLLVRYPALDAAALARRVAALAALADRPDASRP